ncbi:MAG: DsbA family protein [Nanobdellota archaeon]
MVKSHAKKGKQKTPTHEKKASKKTTPHKKHHEPGHHKKKAKTCTPGKRWKIASLGLAVLLIASIITGGFGLNLFPEQQDTIGMTVITDSGCENCEQIIEQIVQISEQQLFTNTTFEVTTVDASEREGEDMIQQYGLTKAPSFIFEKEIANTAGWTETPQLPQSFTELEDGSYKIMDEAIGATYYLDEEKQEAQEAKLENYPQDNLQALGYEGDKPRLDYFVMAFCPYGNPADEAAGELYDLFGDRVEIVPHYIISVNGDSIQSLHGEPEGNQGVRELCALKELGEEAYFDFTLAINDKCTAQDVDTCWEETAQEAGVDVSAIKNCYEENRLDIAQEESQTIENVVTEQQGSLVPPTASPTFLINGKTHSGSRDAESLKTALCQEFEGTLPAECEEVVSSQTQTAQGSC